jgi:AraC family transcriptional regulator of arabinose operon
MYSTSNSIGIHAGTELSAMLYQFLIELDERLKFKSECEMDRDVMARLQPLLGYMSDDCHKPITLHELADFMHISPQYLCRVFKQSLDLSPITYLTQCRIRRAKELLASHNSQSIAEVAQQCGFASSNYFCTVFRRHTGVSPGEYRAMF